MALAELQPDRTDNAHLLDLYVPLPVACTLVIETEEERIVEWWVKEARGGGRTTFREAASFPEG